MSEHITDYLGDLFQETFKIKQKLNVKYITFLFKAAESFAKTGFYGTSIDKLAEASQLNRVSIRIKMNKAELFQFIVLATEEICAREIFTHLKDKASYVEKKRKFIEEFKNILFKYTDFFITSLLGHQFNNERELNDSVINFHKQWHEAILTIAPPFNFVEPEEVARSSLVYLVGELSIANKRPDGIKYIEKAFLQLENYWNGKTSILLPSESKDNRRSE